MRSLKLEFSIVNTTSRFSRDMEEIDVFSTFMGDDLAPQLDISTSSKVFVDDTKNAHSITRNVAETSLEDDGFSWRKYGQKELIGSRYPRSYYRCKHTTGCKATKVVQRACEGNTYNITYRGSHTCSKYIGVLPFEEKSTGGASDTQSSKGLYDIDDDRIPQVQTALTETKQESIITSTTALMESKREVSAESMFGTYDRMKKEGESGSRISHCRFTNLKREPDLYSWTSVKSSGINEFNLHMLSTAFWDVEVKKIGIYGNGGIGKTAVMKAFISHYDLNSFFDSVLWVTISRCSSRRKIQNKLVQQLLLNVPNSKSDDEVARILFQTLLVRKFVLFLDDLRDSMDLLRVGIPINSVGNNYRIIMTARSINICEAMGVDRIIKAEVLPMEESLQLFRLHVGHVMDSRDIEPYVRAIVDECSGLPLVIKVAGRALRMENNKLAWKHALKDILLTNNLQVLKIGYDKLKEQDMRSCFLYSALFTESKAVRISSLVEYLVDEGCVVGSLTDAYGRGRDIIKHLIDVSLLEYTNDGLMVEMHDLICDLALNILSDVKGLQMLLSRYFRSILLKENILFDMSYSTIEWSVSTETAKDSPSESHQSILKAGEGLSEPPSEKEWEEAKMVILMDNRLSSLPKSPACSKLLLLFLQRNSSLRAIPSSFFENMSSLQVLNLSKTRIKSLPQSLSKLECLQVLILRNCERLLFLPSEIGALKHLLVLDAYGTEICQLPDQISDLLCLIHLHVCFYGSMDHDECSMLPLELISKGIISKLIQLRELSIIVYPGDPRWTMIAWDVTIEVSNLNLCSLSFHFPVIEYLEYFINVSPAWLHQTLTHFNFIVGHDVKGVVSHVYDDLELEYKQQNRCLRLVDGEDIPDAILEVLSQATAFYLDHHLAAHSLTQFGWATMNDLKLCVVKDCPKLKTIVNCKELTGNNFTSLELLSIHYCWNLSWIWMGTLRAGSFSMLRRLSVHSCPKLEFVLSRPIVAVLSKLEELIVEDCQSLENVISNQDQIFADDDTGDNDFAEHSVVDLSTNEDNAKDPMEGFLPEFARIKVLKLHYLPKLVNIWSGGDFPCLEYVSVYNCPRLKKLDLKPRVEFTIKEIKAETAWWNDLDWDQPTFPAKLMGCFKEIRYDDICGAM